MNMGMNKQDYFKQEFILAMTTLYGVNQNKTEELQEIIRGIDFEALSQKLMGDMETVYIYTVDCDKSYATAYRSEPLFEKRAAKICTIFERGCCSEISDEYETELWMLEDYRFAIVKVFRISMRMKGGYQTEYRTLKGYLPKEHFIPCELIDFNSVIQRHIEKYYDMQTPICEI